LPQYGDSLAKEAGGKPDGLKGAISDLEEQRKLLSESGELTAQSFGRPDPTENGRFRSFTVTTRIVNNLVTGELSNVLRKEYAGQLEPDPVELNELTLILRLKDMTLTKDKIDQKLKVAMNNAALDPAYANVKNDLQALSVVEVTPRDDFLEAKVRGFQPPRHDETGKNLPSEQGRMERVKQAVALADIADKIGGPISRTSAFGAQVAGETGLMSLVALLIANLAVFVYLWFRFEFSGAWGFGAIVALLHDVIIAAGAVIIAHKLGFPILINLNIVAALLTITGFSVNDTIVVFDRIREVKAAHPTRTYEEIVNEAINATLSRTILTSLTVILSVLSLLIFGGPTIKDMAFTLLIGFLVGTYSSIFIASPLMIWWYKRFGSGRAPVPTTARKSDVATAQGAQI
jgi:preprotein translocase SecF subunit